jgi:serine palmitoyltransferase
VNSPHVTQATQISMLVCSTANDLNSSGEFCIGSHIVPDHGRVNCTSFVFSATVPALPDVSISMGINILRNMQSIQSTLPQNVHTVRAVLDCVEAITIPSYAALPITYIHPCSATPSSATLKAPNPVTTSPREPSSFDIAGKRHMLQDIMDKVLERRK